jgi:hypothetical protein
MEVFDADARCYDLGGDSEYLAVSIRYTLLVVAAEIII